jgi:hypothetical protein
LELEQCEQCPQLPRRSPPPHCLLSLPQFGGHPESHESAVGVIHGKAGEEEAESILG